MAFCLAFPTQVQGGGIKKMKKNWHFGVSLGMMMFRDLLNLIRPARMSVVSVCVPSHDYRKQPEWWKF